jgi:hypothetical protein
MAWGPARYWTRWAIHQPPSCSGREPSPGNRPSPAGPTGLSVRWVGSGNISCVLRTVSAKATLAPFRATISTKSAPVAASKFSKKRSEKFYIFQEAVAVLPLSGRDIAAVGAVAEDYDMLKRIRYGEFRQAKKTVLSLPTKAWPPGSKNDPGQEAYWCDGRKLDRNMVELNNMSGRALAKMRMYRNQKRRRWLGCPRGAA